jgi:alkylated DNA repair dioxygenase AlkB
MPRRALHTKADPRHPGLFGAPATPPGFRYRTDFLSPDEERDLVRRFEVLPFKEFEFHGYTGKRRVVSYGWRYDFSKQRLSEAEPIPDFLLPFRDRAAAFAGLDPSEIRHALLTEYSLGAPIGWHRDRPAFDKVVGISLLSACTFRFRKKAGRGWERVSIVTEPRSAYLLDGPARTEWEHSIPPVEALRYSITFRSMRERPKAGDI